MSTSELIYEKAKKLPEPLQAEALHYVDFLLSRSNAEEDAADWKRFSAEQLARQYAPTDAIYDKE
jgi:hypothetical protein